MSHCMCAIHLSFPGEREHLLATIIERGAACFHHRLARNLRGLQLAGLRVLIASRLLSADDRQRAGEGSAGYARSDVGQQAWA